jgi:DNA-binding IclR family transcriptional regulator
MNRDLSLQEIEILESIEAGDGWVTVKEAMEGTRFSHSSVKEKLKDMTEDGHVKRKRLDRQGAPFGYKALTKPLSVTV